MTIMPDRLRALADGWPDAEAHRVVGPAGGDRMTFGDWRRGANQLAGGLREAGIERGQRVALLFELADVLRYAEAYIAVQQVGAVSALVNLDYTPDELVEILRHAEPDAVLASESVAGRLDEVVGRVDSVRLVVTTGQGTSVSDGWDSLRKGDGDEDIQVEIGDDDPADIVYSSGTTGMPKGVLTRHSNVSQAPQLTPDEFSGDLWLNATMLDAQASRSFLLVPASLGMTVAHLAPAFDARDWVDVVEEEAVGATYLEAWMAREILDLAGVEDRDLSSLHMVTVGGAPIAAASLRRLNELLPNATPQNSYSLVELGTGFTLTPAEDFDRKADTVGQPMGGLEIRIVDPDSGAELPPGEEGEILARTQTPRREYFRAPELTDEAWQDGWLHTGDLGCMDDEGYLHVVGRLDDMIIRRNFNLHPGEIEDLLAERDDVHDSAVVGVPREDGNEEVVAFVVTRDGVSAEDLASWSAERLGEPKRPDRYELVDELPRNDRGKILRKDLVERASPGGA